MDAYLTAGSGTICAWVGLGQGGVIPPIQHSRMGTRTGEDRKRARPMAVLPLLLLLSLNLKATHAPSPSQPTGKADGFSGEQEDLDPMARGLRGDVGGAQGPFEVGLVGKAGGGESRHGPGARSHPYLLFTSTQKQATREMTSTEVGQVLQSGGDFMGGNPCQGSGVRLWNRTGGPGLAQGLGCMGPRGRGSQAQESQVPFLRSGELSQGPRQPFSNVRTINLLQIEVF